MTRRVFTRRRHAVRISLWTMRLALWLGLPLTLGVQVMEFLETPGLPVIGLAGLIVVVVVWSLSVFRAHDLSGEWRFY